ncbi:MAG: hypothetical protein ACLP9S_02680 [Syntrophales bacterium]
MSLTILLVCVFVAGAIGGVVNALLSQNGFLKWKNDEVAGQKIWRPGILGNVIISGVASSISWGLYGPFAAYYILGGPRNESEVVGLTLSSLVGAVLVGVSGARWLTNEVDKNLLRNAASNAAGTDRNQTKAMKIAMATPFDAMKMSLD